MRPNPLYHFAKKFLYQPNPALFFNAKKNARGSDYLLHSFATTSPAKITCRINGQKTRLDLSGHHISIYKNYSPADPLCSAFHYTAYLGNAVKKYKLHVYFEENHKMANVHPYVLQRQEDDTYQPIVIDHKSANRLKNFTLLQTAPFIETFQPLYEQDTHTKALMTHTARERGKEAHYPLSAKRTPTALQQVKHQVFFKPHEPKVAGDQYSTQESTATPPQGL